MTYPLATFEYTRELAESSYTECFSGIYHWLELSIQIDNLLVELFEHVKFEFMIFTVY